MSLISPFEIADHYSMHCWGRSECAGPDLQYINGKPVGVRGLGESWLDYIPLWPSEREKDPCAPSPIWCNYTPGSDYIKECQPIDPVACQESGFGPALTPESRQQAIDAGTQSTDAYLRMNPGTAEAWAEYERRKKCIEAGTSPMMCDLQNYTTYFLMGVGLLGLVLVAKR